jgi:hypothetical protein
VSSAGIEFRQAIKRALGSWNPAKHPRGRDGKFIEVGDKVKVFSSPTSPQIDSGTVVAGHLYDDGRFFVAVRSSSDGKIKWYRPKQIEAMNPKADLAPAIPIPDIGNNKAEDVAWDDKFAEQMGATAKALTKSVEESVTGPNDAKKTAAELSNNNPIDTNLGDVAAASIVGEVLKKKLEIDPGELAPDEAPMDWLAPMIATSPPAMPIQKLNGAEWEAIYGGALDINEFEMGPPDPQTIGFGFDKNGTDLVVTDIELAYDTIGMIQSTAEDFGSAENAALLMGVLDKIKPEYDKINPPAPKVPSVEEAIAALPGWSEPSLNDPDDGKPAEDFGELPEPAAFEIKDEAPQWNIPADYDQLNGDKLYIHPAGGVIVVHPGGSHVAYGANGKKKTTSATAGKLAAGHGLWKPAAVAQDHNFGQFKAIADGNGALLLDPSGKLSYDPANPAKYDPPLNEWEKELLENALPSAAKKTTTKFPSKKAAYAAKKTGAAPKEGVDFSGFTWQDEGIKAPSAPKAEVPPAKAPAAPATSPIKIPAGQTPAGLINMITVSAYNKGLSIEMQKAVDKEVTAALNNPDYEQALKHLAVAMTVAKLGGKQRARYKTLLAMHHGAHVPAPQAPTNTGPAVAISSKAISATKPPGSVVPSLVDGNAWVSGAKSPSGAKAAIQQNLADRLAHINPIEFGKIIADSPGYQTGALNSYEKLVKAMTGQEPMPPGAMIRKGSGGDWGEAAPGQIGAVPATQANLQRAVRETAVNAMIATWAMTSNDSNVRSLAIQQAAAEEFQLDADWLYNWHSKPDQYDEHVAAHMPVYRAFVRAMYDNTQAELKKTGWTHVRLRRGVKTAPSLKDASGFKTVLSGKGTKGSIIQRPLSSFTTNTGTSNVFSGGAGLTHEGYVPIERIMGSALTGFGCQNEYEYVVLGGPNEVVVI